jgi:hypothetical protein
MNESSAREREFHVWVNGTLRETIKAENITEALRLAAARYTNASSCEVYGTVASPSPLRNETGSS